MKQKLTEQELWLLKLEQERYDRSWLEPTASKVEVQYLNVPCRKAHEDPKKREERDRLLFNAGRYAAGARDRVAAAANEKLERELHQ